MDILPFTPDLGDSETFAGVTNVEADFESRNFNDRTKWTLERDIFRKITQ